MKNDSIPDNEIRFKAAMKTQTEVEPPSSLQPEPRQNVALSAHEGQLITILKSTMDAIISIDAEQKIILFNPAAEQMFRCTEEEALGQSIERFIPERFRMRHYDNIQNYGETQQTRRMREYMERLPCLRADGEEFFAEITISQSEINGQKIYTSILRDSTERIRAEEALKTSEVRYHHILDSMTEGGQIIGWDWRYLYVNEVVAQQGRRTPDELLNHTMMEMYPGIEKTALFEALQRCMHARQPTRMENPFTFPDGNVGWFDLSIQPVEEGIFVLSTDITARKLAEVETAKNAETMSALYETTRDLVIEHDLPTLLRTIVERATRLIHAESGGLYLCEPENQQVRCVVSYNTANDYTGYVLKYGEGAAGKVAQTGLPIILNDYGTWEGRANAFEEERPFRAVLTVPMKWQEEVIGVIHVLENGKGREFKDEDLLLVTSFANQAALAVQNARLYSRSQQELADRKQAERKLQMQNRRLQALRQIDMAILSADTIEKILHVGICQVRELLDCAQTSISFYDWELYEGVLFWGDTWDSLLTGNIRYPLTLFEELIRTIEEKQHVLVEDMSTITIPAALQPHFKPEVKSFCFLPLFSRGRLIGTLNLLANSRNFFDEEKINLAKEVANQIAIGITQNRLVEELRQLNLGLEKRVLDRTAQLSNALKRTETLYHVARLLTVFENLPATLQTVVNDGASALSANRTALIIFDTEQRKITQFLTGGPGAEYIVKVTLEELMNGLSGWVLREGKAALSPKNRLDMRESPEAQKRRMETNCGAIIVAPLHYLDQTIGTLTAINQPNEPDFTLQDVELLEAMANQAATAIINARLYEGLQQINHSLENRTTELEAANRELDAFSYSVSHDLRAPLRAINGFSQILLENFASEISPDAEKLLNHIRNSSELMSALINDLLQLSRVGRQGLHRAEVDLSELAQMISTELKITAPHRKVDFEIQTGMTTNGDPGLIRIVLENLFHNAWKYTSKQAEASIQFSTLPQGKDTPTFFVRDNGIGFDMTYAGKLFGPFQRLHSAAEFEGTGIGLATVQRIIARHGGRIWADAKPNKGATFYFQID